MLTGDRMETAINVSMSAGHIYPQTVQLYATGLREEESCKVCDSVANLRSTLKTVLSFLCLALFNRPFLFFFPHTHTLSLPLFFLYILLIRTYFSPRLPWQTTLTLLSVNVSSPMQSVAVAVAHTMAP